MSESTNQLVKKFAESRGLEVSEAREVLVETGLSRMAALDRYARAQKRLKKASAEKKEAKAERDKARRQAKNSSRAAAAVNARISALAEASPE